MYKKNMLIAIMGLGLTTLSSEPQKQTKFNKIKESVNKNLKTIGAVGAGTLATLAVAAGLILFKKQYKKEPVAPNNLTEAQIIIAALSANDNALAASIAALFSTKLTKANPIIESVNVNTPPCIKINLANNDYLLLVLASAQNLYKTKTWKSLHQITSKHYVAQRGECFYMKADNTANGYMIGLNIDEAKKGNLVVTKKYGNFYDYYKKTAYGTAAAGLAIGGTAYGLGYFSSSVAPTPPLGAQGGRSTTPPAGSIFEGIQNTCANPTLEDRLAATTSSAGSNNLGVDSYQSGIANSPENIAQDRAIRAALEAHNRQATLASRSEFDARQKFGIQKAQELQELRDSQLQNGIGFTSSSSNTTSARLGYTPQKKYGPEQGNCSPKTPTAPQ